MDLPLSLVEIILPLVVSTLFGAFLFYFIGSVFALGWSGYIFFGLSTGVVNFLWFKNEILKLLDTIDSSKVFLLLICLISVILYFLFSLFYIYLANNFRKGKTKFGVHVKTIPFNLNKNKK